MTTLLQLQSSLFGADGASSRLADQFVAQWLASHPEGRTIVRDLAKEPVPHLTAERFGAFLAKAGERDVAQQAIVAYSDALIEELRSADVVVIALPMYNFGIPSTLKAYFDHIARAGVTFRYSESGPVGLLSGKRVYVFATRGGVHSGTPADTQTGFVRHFFAFLGMKSVEFVYAEGLAMGEAPRTAALAAAALQIQRLGDGQRRAA